MKERLSKSLTINPVEGQMDSESTESSCLQDKDSAVETSISISLRKRGKDASKQEFQRLAMSLPLALMCRKFEKPKPSLHS